MTSYIVSGVIAFVLLAVNTPSLSAWVGSLLAKSQPPMDGGCRVDTWHPIMLSDVNGKRHSITICSQTAAKLLEDLQAQLDKVSK